MMITLMMVMVMMMITMMMMTMKKADQSDPEIWRLTNWPTKQLYHNNNIIIMITIIIVITTTATTIIRISGCILGYSDLMKVHRQNWPLSDGTKCESLVESLIGEEELCNVHLYVVSFPSPLPQEPLFVFLYLVFFGRPVFIHICGLSDQVKFKPLVDKLIG